MRRMLRLFIEINVAPPQNTLCGLNNRILQSKNQSISLLLTRIGVFNTSSVESAASRKEAEMHKVLKDRFPVILRRIFLKYCIFLKKFDLPSVKIYSFKTACTLRRANF